MLLPVAAALADSPLTSTEFAAAYDDVALVQEAKAAGRLTPALAAQLAAPGVPVDVKAAVVNALGWKIDGKHDADVFARAVAERTGKKPAQVRKGAGLAPEDALVLGYLVAMDDYFHPEKAFELLARARKGRPDSYTVALVDALAHAQKDMETDFCRAWLDYAAVREDPKLRRDLRPAAEAIVHDYMALYADGGCSSD